MAITRAQQVKQMLREGGRIGFRRGAKAPDFNPAQAAANVGKASTASPGRQDPSNFGFDAREAQKSKQYSGITPTDRDGRIIEQYEGTTEMGDVGVVPVPDEERQKKLKKQIQDKKLNLAEKVRLFSLKKLYEQKMEEEEGVFKPIAASVIDSLTPTKLNVYDEVDPAFDMSYYGMSGEDIADVDRLAKAINKGEKTGIISQRDYEDAFYGPEGKPPQGSSGGPDQQLQETDPCKGPNPPAYCFIGDKADETMEAQRNLGGLAPRFAGSIFDFRGMADGGRIGYADGTPSFEEYMRERRGIEQQMSIEQLYKEYIEDMRRKDVAEQKTMAADGGRIGAMEGGIMDLETGRQMYFLGKLVKKATRAVKKIAKSPLGKVAMGAAALKFGPAIFGKGSFNPFLMSPDKGASFDFSGLGKILNKAGLVDLSGGLTLGGKFGLGALTLPFLSDEEEEQDMNMGPELTMEELRAIRNSPYRYMAPRFEGSQYKFAEGGRIGFFKGAVAGGGNISPGTDVKGNVRDDNPFTGGGKDEPPSPPIKDTKQKTPLVVNPIKNLQTHLANNQKLKNAVTLGLITNDEYNVLGGYDVNQTMGLNPFMTGVTSGLYNVYQTLKGDQPVSEIYGDVKRNVEGSFGLPENLQTKYDDIMSMSTEEMIDQLSDQKLAQMADGGRIGFRIGSDSGKDVSGREYGAQSVSTSPSGDNGSSGGDNLTDTTTKQVLENAGKTAVKNVATNKAIEKLGLGGIFGMAPQVAALLGIINSVRNSQTNKENMFADGGRIGFKKGMTRRQFLEIMGGIGAAGAAAKTGLLKLMGKEKTAPVVEKAAEVLGGGTPPPYFFNLVEKIRALGTLVDDATLKERSQRYKYKDFEMDIDNDTGQIEITKKTMGYDDRVGEGVVSEEYMGFKPGQADETTGGKKVVDEYEENTAFTDQDGKMKDVEPGVSEETILEGSTSKEQLEQEIVDQISNETTKIKKAEGGRIPFVFGGGVLKVILQNLAKEKGVSPVEYLRITNYKSLPDAAKRIMSQSEFLKLKEEMTGKRVEMVENIRDMILSRQGFEKSKDDLRKSMNMASEGYGDEAVKMMFPKGSFKSPVPTGTTKDDVMMMEQLIKNLKTKDREVNASGGLAGMLGE